MIVLMFHGITYLNIFIEVAQPRLKLLMLIFTVLKMYGQM